ncbi:chorismate mutase [Actinomadura sp. J1-007]|uniref:chorismate mutase n=1 Tax=Actinomadura sp. J1-007 TaxID=2661913 RepID=UPI0019D69A68|nr:chorismate mutase [Actinomadura sp. J1-007]
MVVAVLAPPGAARAEVPARSLAPLVRVAAERLALADRVAAAKWGTGRPIEDAARERELLADVARRSGEMGIDPGRSVAVFRDQIEAAKLVERGCSCAGRRAPGGPRRNGPTWRARSGRPSTASPANCSPS